MTYAVMQPYFFPYGGYYQLLASVDIFVIFDNAQFPRRGRVHRCKGWTKHQGDQWLTLPVAYAPQKVDIKDMRLNLDRWDTFTQRIESFPLMVRNLNNCPALEAAVTVPKTNLIDFLEAQLVTVITLASLQTRVIRASQTLNRLGDSYQEYICKLGEHLGQDAFLNLSGGRDLYSADRFHASQLDLQFMEPYEGAGTSILELPNPLEW